MRVSWLMLLICLAVCSGCSSSKPGKSKNQGPVYSQGLIVTPETGLAAQVVKVNPNGRFVILTFPLGQLPTPGRTLNLYRRGLKVGEVQVTPMQRDDSVVADLTAGEAQVGDEARDR